MDESLTRSFSNGRLPPRGESYFDQRAPSVKQLVVEVSELHAGDDGELRLTCMSTIPGYIVHSEDYGDVRRRSVKSKCPGRRRGPFHRPPLLQSTS